MRAAQGKEEQGKEVAGTRRYVCTEKEKELKSNAEGKRWFVDTLRPQALRRRLRREGNKKSSIS